MTGDGGLVEVQATAERTPLSRAHLDDLLALAARGIDELRAAQERGDRGGRTREARACCRPRNAAQGARVRRLLDGHEVGRAARRRRAAARDRARRSPTTRWSRRARPRRRPARRRSPTTRGSRPRRSAARRACARRASPASDATDAENLDQAAARGAGRQPRCAYVCALASSTGAARSASSRAAARARSPRSRAATAASATTRRSCPTTSTTDRTMAELSPAEKDAISHRGRAARELRAWLEARRAAGAPLSRG